MDRKRAIITGGNRGIGLAIARRLHHIGYEVLSVSREGFTSPKNEIGPNSVHIRADIGSHAGREIVKRMLRRAGWDKQPVDTLVNNAGIAKAALLENTPLSDHAEMMAVNYMGAVFMTQIALPMLKLNGGGSIVNVTSISGLTGFSTMSAYCASKFALTGFALVAAKELAKHRIRVNNVCPGPTQTEMWAELDKQYRKINGWETDEQSEHAYLSKLLIKRMGHPEDVAAVVEFLVDNNKSQYITGTNMKVCGGNLIG